MDRAYYRITFSVVFFLLITATILFAQNSTESDLPTIVITSPKNGAVISGSKVQVLAEFRSNDKQQVSSIKVYLDGKFISERTFNPPVSKGNAGFLWDTVRTKDGSHRLDIQMFAGEQYLAMATCVVTVSNKSKELDTEPPQVAVLNPTEGQTISGKVKIEIQARDNSGQPPYVTISIDKVVKAMRNFPPYTYEWDTTEVPNGPHTIEVKAIDNLDNRRDSKPVRVIVKNPSKGAPVVAPSTRALPTSSPKKSDVAKEPVVKVSSVIEEYKRTTPIVAEVVHEKLNGEKNSSLEPDAQGAPEVQIVKSSVAGAIESIRNEPGIAVQAPDDKAKTDAFQTKQEIMSEYIVKEGDSLIRIANEFDVPVAKLISLNDIKDPSLIRIGDKLRIPQPQGEVLMVPIRPVFEAVKGTIVWDGESKTVRALSSEYDITLQLGSAEAIVNFQPVIMEKEALVQDGRIMVPASFIKKTLGMGEYIREG
ncbi:MAG: LysM peptidoglycan-binding domain-containing protein [Armatimonadetes bacterium]|nr:LysM peptidoglycan-binding domain-containing protein [Armatimonadota bacterium]